MSSKRNYVNSVNQSRVENTYKEMYERQTLQYVLDAKQTYIRFPNLSLPIWSVVELLETIIDESDPDSNSSQMLHATQTALEIIDKYCLPNSYNLKTNIPVKSLFSNYEWVHLPRYIKTMYSVNFHELYSDIKDWGWFPFVGFIHDLGKVLVHKKFGRLSQWSVVGDTFPVGCHFSSKNIFYHKKYHHNNPDYNKYHSYGIYTRNCGFDNVHMSFGHDEYLASVLKINKTHLPREAIYIIRFHSFYAWHTPKNTNIRGYTHLASQYDWKMLPLLKAFQKADLYSKKDGDSIDIQSLKDFFNPFISKYIGDKDIVW